MNTICALATAPGRAGVAVIRVSGPEAFSAARMVTGELPDVGTHRLRVLRDASGQMIDRALVLVFAGPHSFTGENTVELQIHGSSAVTSAVLDALQTHEDVRLAEAGEFTRRALQNGRLDLTQVEGLADLINAETRAQLDQALQVSDGALGSIVEGLRADLIRAAALIEATIDFADEDVPTDVTPDVLDLIDRVLIEMRDLIDGAQAAERIRNGFEVAIVGAPNVGKSTLLNYLAGREAAITSDIAGTTRDVIEVRMDIGGLAVTLLDTAGIRDSENEIEAKGVALAQRRAEAADLRLFLLGSNDQPPMQPRTGDLVLRAKDDAGVLVNGISGRTGVGVSRLIADLSSELSNRVAKASLASHDRHRQVLTNAISALQTAQEYVEAGYDMADIAAEELRNAIRQLETLVGRIGVEDLLDEIFSSFCIGK